ncbi:hypothetical protein DCO48_21755 [Pseudomonas sp. SDI]|nr:hypothetical protein DCO48_21755 [Pseudomonas sp. SDI]
MGLAVLFGLLVVDSGRLYLEQRKLQRAADMAALEAVTGRGDCLAGGTSALDLAKAAAARNGHALDADHTLSVACGMLNTGAASLRSFTVDANRNDAIRVTLQHSVPSSVAMALITMMSGKSHATTIKLQAQATAGRIGPPLAQLNITSTLLSIDTGRSQLLNQLMSSLLGAQVNLNLAQWQGLLQANVNLLQYLDKLAIKATVNAGNYTELLGKTIKLGDVFLVMADVAAQNNPLVDVSGLLSLSALTKDAGGIVLGELLNIQNGGTNAGLDANLKALQLVQAMAQLANSKHAAEIELPISLLGLANISTRIRIIEPPQFSAIGDPREAKADPRLPKQIYVRTAQTRILISLDLKPLLGGLNLGIVQLTPNPSLDVGLEVSSASSHVTGFNCASAASKSLTVDNQAAAAKVMIGTINRTNFFTSTNPANASPMVLLRVALPLVPVIDIGLGANSPLFSSNDRHTYLRPPELGQASASHHLSSSNIVASLRATLAGVELSPQIPLVSLVLNLVTGVIGTLLGSLLDPIINNLLTLLGIDLNGVDVGANLSCITGRPQLVL